MQFKADAFYLLFDVYSTLFFFYMENLFMCIYVLTYLTTGFVSSETMWAEVEEEARIV